MKTQTPEEEAVAAAAATVAAASAKIAELDAEIAAARQAISIAKQQHEQHAFKASTADAHAMAIVQKAQARQSDAEQRLGDLFNRLWPAAKQELEQAKQAERNARRALEKPHREAKMRERVAVSARMDKRFAEIAADYELYQQLGRELLNLAQDGFMQTRYEDCVGHKRITAALPMFLESVHARLPGSKFVPLAESERQFWNLAPEQPDEKAA